MSVRHEVDWKSVESWRDLRTRQDYHRSKKKVTGKISKYSICSVLIWERKACLGDSKAVAVSLSLPLRWRVCRCQCRENWTIFVLSPRMGIQGRADYVSHPTTVVGGRFKNESINALAVNEQSESIHLSLSFEVLRIKAHRTGCSNHAVGDDQTI